MFQRRIILGMLLMMSNTGLSALAQQDMFRTPSGTSSTPGQQQDSSGASDENWQNLLSEARSELSAGRLDKAEEQFKAAEKACEDVKLGPTDGDGFKKMSKGVADCLIGLAAVNERRGDAGEADRLYELAVRTVEKAYTSDSMDYAKYLPPLADLYDKHGKPDKAELVHKKIIDVRTRMAPNKDDPSIVQGYDHYARYLRSKDRPDEATIIENKSNEIKYKNQNKSSE